MNVCGFTSQRVRPAPSESSGRTLTMKVSFDLGDDFRVRGRGVDTRLAGTVEIQGAAQGLPQMVGLIHAVGGGVGSPADPIHFVQFSMEELRAAVDASDVLTAEKPGVVQELSADYIVPSVFDRGVAPAVARAVAETAVAQGVARDHLEVKR